MTTEEHLRGIYVTSTTKVGKRTCLVLMCSRCGTETITSGFDVGAVITAAKGHLARAAEVGA